MRRLNSKQKGARGERMWRDFLRLFGFEARRGQQFSGNPEAPDVISNVVGVHWEVKHVEKLNIRDAMEQALRDCGESVPIIAHKTNRQGWLCTIQAGDLLMMLQRMQPQSKCLTSLQVSLGLFLGG